jgi:hypothetical protein
MSATGDDEAKLTRSEAVDKMLMDLSCMDLTTEDADDLVSMVRSRGGRVSFYEDEHDRDGQDMPCKRCGKPYLSRARPYFGRKYVPPAALDPTTLDGGVVADAGSVEWFTLELDRSERVASVAITADEFERRYAERSGITVELMRSEGYVVRPCHCGEEVCEGWKMTTPEAYNRDVAARKRMKMPPP